MLESIDLDKKLGDAEYDKVFRPLRDRLDDLQRAITDAKVPICIVFEGWDAAGKGDSIEKLLGRLDPRGYKVHSIFDPNVEELLRPFLWRFAVRMPGRGEIAIFDRSWYWRVLEERVARTVSKQRWQAAYNAIGEFERMHADDGTVFVKLWLHISEKEQRRRFRKMEKSKFDHWRVTKQDWKTHKRYDRYYRAAEEMLERTNTAFAPWTIVESTDRNWRRIKVFETIATALERAVEEKAAVVAAAPGRAGSGTKSAAARVLAKGRSLLDRVDLRKKLPEARYDTELKDAQVRLRRLAYRCFVKRRAVIVVYEGWDAAGKGGNIKRLTGCLDPRGYDVIPIAAPKGDDASHHYLWRFWRRLPKDGHLALFDRSWYGRVLVERVEGFAREAEWRRAYGEINQFELDLANHGTIIVKYWLHISKQEQLRRFKERQGKEHKHYKITDEDWRNREKWDLYRSAVHDMLVNTSTTVAPWTIVEANDKYWARIRAVRTLIGAIEAAL
jgi:polyphosphate:AMP phosphotransferase